MSERTTVRLPPELLASAKRKAAAEGRTLTSLIEDVLRVIVSEPKASKSTERILPRVSTATGSPWPGIDISNSAQLQEMEDLEYIERMKHFR